MRRCAVVGSPIGHSLSPALHRAACRRLGLDWVYERHDVTTAGLAQFVAGLDATWRGLSCTMPLKSAVVDLGRPDEVVTALGVANTVVFDGPATDYETTSVYNTDVTGFTEACRQAAQETGRPTPETALVLGAGATATSALYALGRLGATQVQLAGRNRAALAHLRWLAASWGVTVTPQPLDGPWKPVDLAICTLPAPVAAGLADRVTAAAGTVFDVLYDPWPTPLVTVARAAGRPTITGLSLLVHQAAGQIRLMTGREVALETLLSGLGQASSRFDGAC